MLAKKKADHRLPGQKSPLQPDRRTISPDSRRAVIITHPYPSMTRYQLRVHAHTAPDPQ